MNIQEIPKVKYTKFCKGFNSNYSSFYIEYKDFEFLNNSKEFVNKFNDIASYTFIDKFLLSIFFIFNYSPFYLMISNLLKNGKISKLDKFLNNFEFDFKNNENNLVPKYTTNTKYNNMNIYFLEIENH